MYKIFTARRYLPQCDALLKPLHINKHFEMKYELNTNVTRGLQKLIGLQGKCVLFTYKSSYISLLAHCVLLFSLLEFVSSYIRFCFMICCVFNFLWYVCGRLNVSYSKLNETSYYLMLSFKLSSRFRPFIIFKNKTLHLNIVGFYFALMYLL